MFKSPFSFRGRIRRSEYALSFLIYLCVVFFFSFISTTVSGRSNSDAGGIVLLFVLIPCLYFMLAQGVKRSHDLGNSGWFLLIPLYGFLLLFAGGEPGENRFGVDPKRKGDAPVFSFEEEAGQLRN